MSTDDPKHDLPPPIPDATPRPEDILTQQAASAAAPAPAAPAAPALGAAAAAGPRPYEQVLEQFAHEYLKDRRSERRWRGFYRLLWLGLIVLLLWGLFAQRHHVAPPSTPHTALVEVRGEIAADTEASAELLLSEPFADPKALNRLGRAFAGRDLSGLAAAADDLVALEAEGMCWARVPADRLTAVQEALAQL